MKKINQQPIPRTRVLNGQDFPEPAYTLLEQAIANWHPDLATAKFCLAWNYGWAQQDGDKGKAQLGSVQKCSDLYRQLTDYDWVIYLNPEVWRNGHVTDETRMAILDHCLCYIVLDLDKEGEPKTDENGRQLYRKQEPDLVEFSEVLERHGFGYREELSRLVDLVKSNLDGYEPVLESSLASGDEV